MNERTQRIYARIADLRCAQSGQRVHQALHAVQHARQDLEQTLARRSSHTAQIHQHLAQGASPALAALEFHHHLHATQQEAQLKQVLQQTEQRLSEARHTQRESMKTQKSAEKMAEKLDLERRARRARKEQLGQDDLAGIYPAIERLSA